MFPVDIQKKALIVLQLLSDKCTNHGPDLYRELAEVVTNAMRKYGSNVGIQIEVGQNLNIHVYLISFAKIYLKKMKVFLWIYLLNFFHDQILQPTNYFKVVVLPKWLSSNEFTATYTVLALDLNSNSPPNTVFQCIQDCSQPNQCLYILRGKEKILLVP